MPESREIAETFHVIVSLTIPSFPSYRKRWEEKGRCFAETAVTYLLNKGRAPAPHEMPIYWFAPKEPAIAGDGGAVPQKLTACKLERPMQKGTSLQIGMYLLFFARIQLQRLSDLIAVAFELLPCGGRHSFDLQNFNRIWYHTAPPCTELLMPSS